MAVTRINNNQITSAVNGNAYLGINAAVKLQAYSITSTRIANNLVYGSDLTVSGNLVVNGTTTTIDTVNTLIQDPLITLADGQTAGTPTVDIGLIGLRGNQNSSFIGWKESSGAFVTALSNTTVSNTTANITSYANLITGNLSVVGNVIGSISFSGNITAGNLLTPGLVSAAGNVTGGNILTAGLVSATSNVTGGNILTAGLITATGNISGGNLRSAGNVDAPSAFVNAGAVLATGRVEAGTTMSAGGNITSGGNVNVAGFVTATGNITGGNVLTAGLVSATGNLTSGNVNTAGLVTATGNVTGGNILTAGLISATSTITSAANISGANFLTSGLISATGNVTGGNINTAGLITATGNITTAGALNGANLSLSGNVLSALNVTGNITGGNLLSPGLLNVTGNATAGNINTSGLVTATGNITGANILTAGLISAGGNITTATNLNTPNVVATGNLALVGGNINLTPTGNVVLNNTYINSVAQPVQNNDVATKIYVDNAVSTQIAYHQAVTVATVANLATTTGGTITYTQPNGAGNGVGALLTTTGSFNLIDTANVQTVGTRILVKNEGNAVFNGVYTWANATNIVRSTDTDQYGPNSSEELSINDYFFVTSGNVNKGSAYVVDAPSGTITFGTSNISFAQFSSSQTYTGGNGISLYGTVISTVYDNSTIGVNGSNQLYIPANAPLVTPNIGAATGTSLSVTGAITAGTTLSSVGNTIAGNVTTAGLISATGNVTGGNVLTAGLISATGNLTSGNVNTTNISLSGNVISALNVTGNIAGGNITTPGLISSTGNVTGGNFNTAGLITATGNITGGNLLTGGLISSTGNLVAGNISTAGNVTAAYFIGNIQGNIDAAGANTQIQFNTTGDILGANANFTYDYATNLMTVNGGNIATGNLSATGQVTATANITGGNILTGGVVSATANITGGNVLTGGLISATGNATAGNIMTAGLLSATGTGTFGNLRLGPDSINDIGTNQTITVNSTNANTNFAVNSSTVGNVLYVSAANSTVGVGSSQTYVNAIVALNATTSLLLPAGTTVQRPSNASSYTGMIRFNTTSNGLEVFNNSEWTDVGGTTFTVIADQQFNGDGSTVQFTLGSTQTTNSCIVSINGIVQIPNSAYSVAGTYPTCYLTFTEAPAAADLIDVREITTTTTVTAIQNNSGNATVTGNSSAAQIDVLGNLVPNGNLLYSLGSSTNYWKSLYVGGNTIYLGGLQLQSATGNVFNVYASDGTTPATFGNIVVGGNLSGNISTNSITNSGANGTGNIGNATNGFNTIFAKATSAQYADLAEKYVADAEYAPGTVVSFGGEKEVTLSSVDSDRAVAGVISTNPSYIMNATLEAEHVATVAFTGRVPTSVTGTVAKGDLMVSNGDGTARAEEDPKAGAIIGKALENFNGETGVIEVVIGRF